MTEEEKRREKALAAIAHLRSMQLTDEEKQVLDDFEEFRRKQQLAWNHLASSPI
jgi:hypothetical protein